MKTLKELSLKLDMLKIQHTIEKLEDLQKHFFESENADKDIKKIIAWDKLNEVITNLKQTL